MKAQMAKDIADLPKPSWDPSVVDSKDTLMNSKEFSKFMEGEGKNLTWNNYFEDIDKNRQYRGQWSKDRKTWGGIGEIKFSDGSLYQGMVKNKLFNGKGRITHANADIYQGEWKDGKANGQGVFVDQDGSMYDGEWVDDKQHGTGTEIWNSGQIKYTGDFVDGKKSGTGRFEFEGSYYEGDFVDGKFEGRGKYYFAESGKIYEGEFQDNSMNRTGVMVWPDQTRYEGHFKNGKMSGRGIKQFANGNRFVGSFKNDLYDGSGIWYDYKSQTKRQGEWAKGKRIQWISEPQETQVTGYGDQTGTSPHRPREGGRRMYRGGAWRQDQADEIESQAFQASQMATRPNKMATKPKKRFN